MPKGATAKLAISVDVMMPPKNSSTWRSDPRMVIAARSSSRWRSHS